VEKKKEGLFIIPGYKKQKKGGKKIRPPVWGGLAKKKKR